MTWPANSSNIVTTNLDSGTDSPALARADIKAALDEITNLINGRNEASGVAGLSASSKIANTQLPDTIVSSSATDLTLDPNTGVVQIQDVFRLTNLAYGDLPASPSAGMVAFLTTDGASVSKNKLIYYKASAWYYVADHSAVAIS